MHKVLILTTGGTIEKTYSEADGVLRNQESMLKARLLPSLRLPRTSIDVIEVMAKDSLDMTTADREEICQEIQKQMKHYQSILVLHGTDTMEMTANFVKEQLSKCDSTVVFTGAMRPATLVDTDAYQNFIEALMACQILPFGIYIAFHNQVLRVPEATKNKSTGTFDPLSSKSDIRIN